MTGEQIKALRKSLNLTQTDLAEKIGTVKNRISEWEHGKTVPRPAYIKLLELLKEGKL